MAANDSSGVMGRPVGPASVPAHGLANGLADAPAEALPGARLAAGTAAGPAVVGSGEGAPPASPRVAPVGKKPGGAGAKPAANPVPQRLFGLPLRGAKVLLFVIGLLPLARWVWLGFTDGFGSNPTQFLTRSSGTWTLVCLLIAMSITPLRQLTKQNLLARVRRMAGLFAFFYAFLHFTTYIWFDQFFDLKATIADIIERPFILLGFSAFILLIPLAVTSTQGWMKRLGKRWGLLHRTVYLIGVLAIVHYWWHKAGKNDFAEVIWYAAVLAALLAWRLLWPYIQAGKRAR